MRWSQNFSELRDLRRSYKGDSLLQRRAANAGIPIQRVLQSHYQIRSSGTLNRA